MKKFLIFVLLLGAVMFITNPKPEAFYQKALREEVGMGDKWFTEAKHSVVSAAYDYETFYVAGIMKDKIKGEVTYVGAFNQVFKVK